MYSVLVADDEKIGRQGVHFLLNQMDEELDIIEAKNGKEALDYIENHHLDILLTDIKMPFLDGIELIKEAIKIQPELKIAIFSGYSDFDYAKKALSLGVLEYILKPVNPEEFKATVKKIIDQVNESKEASLSKAHHEELLKEHILYNLVNGNSDEQIEKQIQRGSLDDYIGHYKRIMMLSSPDNFFSEAETIKEDLIKEIPLAFDYLNLNLNESLLFFEENDPDKMGAIAKSIYNMIQIRYNKKIYIGVTDTLENYEQIQEKEGILEDLLEGMYYHPEKHIYYEYAKEETEVKPFKDIEELTNSVKHDIKMKDIDSIKEDFNAFYAMYSSQSDYSNDYVKFMFSGMIKDIYGVLTNTNEKDLDDMIVKFYRTSDFKSLKKILDEFLSLLEEEFKKSESLSHKEIEDVIRYIYNNYNLDLSVDSLADQVCLAPSYLSHIFKKETGENLGKFIKRVRMEKAKDMLENTHEKIVSVSVAVGYANVSYFCQSFREYYGISPQKFRNQGE